MLENGERWVCEQKKTTKKIIVFTSTGHVTMISDTYTCDVPDIFKLGQFIFLKKRHTNNDISSSREEPTNWNNYGIKN